MITENNLFLFILWILLLSLWSLGCGENEGGNTLPSFEVNLSQLLTPEPFPDGSLAAEVIVIVGEITKGPFPIADRKSDFTIPMTFGNTTDITVEYRDKRGRTLYRAKEPVRIKEEGLTEARIKLCPVKHEIKSLFKIMRIGEGGIPIATRVFNPVKVEADASKSSSTHFCLQFKWDWGDNKFDKSTEFSTDNKESSHIYDRPGSYNITLTVKDNFDKLKYDRLHCRDIGDVSNVKESQETVEVR